MTQPSPGAAAASCVLPVCLTGIEPGGVLEVICAETMIVPEQFEGRNLLVVRVDGDGLAPAIRRGSYVGLDRTKKFVRSGRIYGVMAPVEGLVIKRAVVDPGTKMVVLSDEEKKQPPYRFTPEEFENRVVGQVAWVFQEL